MRDYSIVTPAFWIGATGKQLRGDMESQLLAMYLMTSPHSTMTGVFHCPVLYMAHETGIPFEGATKALQRLIEAGFCEYEEASETVFVVRMASFQIAESLKPGDNRIMGLKKEVAKMASPLMRSRFIALYSAAFCLNPESKNSSPSEAPSKPLRSQEQEQEQEQEIKTLVPSPAEDLPTIPQSEKPDCPHQEIIALYHEVLPQCPQIREWTPARATQLRARWNESEKRQNLTYWRQFFEYVGGCDFLVGRTGKTPFFADLEWMTKSANFTKIREAKYENRVAA